MQYHSYSLQHGCKKRHWDQYFGPIWTVSHENFVPDSPLHLVCSVDQASSDGVKEEEEGREEKERQEVMKIEFTTSYYQTMYK